MLLHATTWGAGPADVLLLHGMMGAGSSWWRVSPLIAERGHRVIALDLPGHGDSAPLAEATVERVVALVVETWGAHSSAPPQLAMGHSYGGTILAAALETLHPVAAVYVDSPFRKTGGSDPMFVRARYTADKAARTYEGLLARRPFYSHEDRVVESCAAERFDIETAVSLSAGPGGDWTPSSLARSLVIRPEPSRYITAADDQSLQERGIEVRTIPDAEHSIWYSHFDEFMTAIDDRY